MVNSGWLTDFTFLPLTACVYETRVWACVRSWPRTPFPSVCLNVGLVVPPACTEAPRGAKSCPQTGSWAWPGTCRVLPSLWTASWLWTEGAGGGNQSISVSLSLSFLRKPSSSPAAPSRSGCQPPPDLSCTQVERRRGGGGMGRKVGERNSSSKDFLRIKWMKSWKRDQESRRL